MFRLQGEVRKLEEAKRRNLRRGRGLALVCLISALLIVAVAYVVYDRTVLSYAVLEDIEIRQDPVMDWRINVSYRVVKPGRVAFSRRSGKRHTEKLDAISEVGPNGFTWAWPSDPATGIDFNVVYREGWSRATVERHFAVTTKRVGEP
jgi:hypothetical protein